ncbi:beta-ketoacyl-ACP synthase 3 [Streptomyces sp. TLI_053]|uniref:beta-ketoacyl-ACP synthase 3 n=1 Tax=Streptomyces sp. TLI_053 TaxID=1855352 RepID=UPI001E47F57D|nr:beta-ketoacyl-ACP synthase 3 [Streptomyces sp. TLI_053]
MCALGTARPEHMVANEDIAPRLGVTPDWIARRTGIHRRARAATGTSTADLATEAAELALAQRPDPDMEVDALIVATITPDRRCPATAPEVAARLGLAGIPAFDIAAACTGLLYALQIASALIRSATHRGVLVIAADRIPSLVDPDDRTTAPLFGDGAAALLLRAGQPHEHGALGPVVLGADGRHADTVSVEHGGFMAMHGPQMFQHAVTHLAAGAERALAAAGWSLAGVDRFVPHQANTRITDAVARRLGLDEHRILDLIADTGNTSAASIPLALSAALAEGRVRPGQRLLLSAAGAGLTWGAATLLCPDHAPPATARPAAHPTLEKTR